MFLAGKGLIRWTMVMRISGSLSGKADSCDIAKGGRVKGLHWTTITLLLAGAMRREHCRVEKIWTGWH